MSETLLQIIEAFKEWARALTESLRDGRITVSQWYTGMERIITRAHIAAMIEGLGTSQIPPQMLETIKKNVNYQLGYLDNFKDVIESSPDFVNGWVNRSALYGQSATTSFWEGKIIQDFGRALPLPAMPNQGTICRYCGCEWRVIELDKEAGNYDAYWEKPKKDSCQVCIQRRSDWYPVRIRNMMLM